MRKLVLILLALTAVTALGGTQSVRQLMIMSRLYEDPWVGILQDTPEYYIAAAGDPPASSPLPVLRYYYEQMAGFTPAAIPILVVISMAYLMRRSDVCDE